MKQTRIVKFTIAAAAVLLVGILLWFVISRLAGPGSAPILQDAAFAAVVQTTAETKQTATQTVTEPKKPSDWRLMLVNEDNAVPDDYDTELLTLSNGKKVDERMYPDLQEMFDTMRSEGVYPVVSEGYRTDAEQRSMMEEQIAQYQKDGYDEDEARTMAADYVAQVGYSEHQLGLAVDINADKSKCENETVYNWLAEHAAEYGFILRYPSDKEDITGIAYEPWHYRYVGKENAKKIAASGLCLEEFLSDGNEEA